jgi:hypothetical protein
MGGDHASTQIQPHLETAARRIDRSQIDELARDLATTRAYHGRYLPPGLRANDPQRGLVALISHN